MLVQWDRIENKFAATSLAVAATLGMWSAGGVVSVLNRHLFFSSFSRSLLNLFCTTRLTAN
jgi:hypothetical protein